MPPIYVPKLILPFQGLPPLPNIRKLHFPKRHFLRRQATVGGSFGKR